MLAKFNQFQLSKQQQVTVLGGTSSPDELLNQANQIRAAAEFAFQAGLVSGAISIASGVVTIGGSIRRPAMGSDISISTEFSKNTETAPKLTSPLQGSSFYAIGANTLY